jgi:hypothetical protein
VSAVSVVLAAVFLWMFHGWAGSAFMDGPPLAVTGGFGEASCHQCHFDNDLNAPTGSVSIEGLPEVFVPGERYGLIVTLSRGDIKVGGFQMTARFTDGQEKGRQAGELSPTDARTTVLSDEQRGVAYAQHSRLGTTPTAGDAAAWRLDWVAPTSGGKVAFNVAAVAGDGDLSSFGDFVYVREVLAQALQK